jgi:hypothetical protein
MRVYVCVYGAGEKKKKKKNKKIPFSDNRRPPSLLAADRASHACAVDVKIGGHFQKVVCIGGDNTCCCGNDYHSTSHFYHKITKYT